MSQGSPRAPRTPRSVKKTPGKRPKSDRSPTPGSRDATKNELTTGAGYKSAVTTRTNSPRSRNPSSEEALPTNDLMTRPTRKASNDLPVEELSDHSGGSKLRVPESPAESCISSMDLAGVGTDPAKSSSGQAELLKASPVKTKRPTPRPSVLASFKIPVDLFGLLGGPDPVEANFAKATQETKESPHYAELFDRDGDATLDRSDYFMYKLENSIAADPAVRFYILLFVSLVSCVALSIIWVLVARNDGDHELTNDGGGAMFMVFQVLITGGYDSSILETTQRLAFFVTILVGVSIVSILIGLISDTVNEYMEDLSSGSSKVVEEGHTLILGWNESTTRVVCQIAFLRRIYLMQNETWARRLFPWTRVHPSSPVSAAPVVIMNNTQEKEDMEILVRDAFAARNINPKRTKIGRDVVFRKGDPTENHDLVRVAAHKASSIVVMMTAADRQGLEDSGGSNENSGSIRTVLALRNLMFSNGDPAETFPTDLRVVVQLSSSCPFLGASAFVTPWGKKCLFAQDVGKSVNRLLFKSSSHPGLVNVLMQIMGFEGKAIKCRSAHELRAGPDNKEGWFVGKTMKVALLHHGWKNAQLIGSDDDKVGEFDFQGDADGLYNEPGSPGIMGDPDRLVKASDTMIFICDSSTPTFAGSSMEAALDLMSGGDGASPGSVSALENEAKKYLTGAVGATLTGSEDKSPQHMLLCGWRQEWASTPQRFKDRLKDMRGGLPLGSVVTCANLLDSQSFEDCMTSPEVGFELVDDSAPGPSHGHSKSTQHQTALRGSANHSNESATSSNSPLEVTKRKRFSGFGGTMFIEHHAGDPANFNGMKRLFGDLAKQPKGSCTRGVDIALVLGTMATIVLPPGARDARVLSILLILRKLAEDEAHDLGEEGLKGMHAIAENEQDQTAMLAVCPASPNPSTLPDFVNTQQIIARSLAMNLAYPQIQDAVSEIVLPDGPGIEFITCQHLGIAGFKVSFGAVRSIVVTKYEGRAIPIGYVYGPKKTIVPDVNKIIEWTNEYRVICLVRGGVINTP
mmetsp:Transcript_13606/g.27862  ORF Transcript_13606/g.27862 Transcript_13606/m.27862 type:complete len:1028 (-) Transcript_13606:78-3161(-)